MFVPFRVLLLPLLLTLAACGPTVDPGNEQPLPDPGADGGLPVDTQLLEGPTGTVASPSARFTFSSNVDGATFECSLDGAAFAPCSSPADYAQLADGAHTFRVRALLTGAADQTPATRSWSVDTVAPQARISSGPSGATAASSATFTFTASDAGTLECALDDAAFAPCTSPQDYTGLSEGAHRFQVRERDATTGAASAPDLRSWTVDTLAPETSISAGPAAGATEPTRTASFSFTSSETGSTFECALDAVTYSSCASPKSYTELADGSHTFSVRARDAAGNLDETPETRTWTVDGPLTSRLRLMAANTTSGNNQSYDPGHGARIFQGLDPDVVMIQEFKYGDNSASAIRGFVDTHFGAGFSYYREAESTDSIPNGIISRWPIIKSGEWTDTQVSDRDFAWAHIDVPGPANLWVVSVHLWSGGGSTGREAQARLLLEKIKLLVPESDYLVIGGDLNTGSRTETCVSTLSEVVVTAGPYPVDQNGDGDTNNGATERNKPYDWVLVDGDLQQHATSVAIGGSTYPSGLVFDSRVYTPLTEVSPVLYGDSGVTGMQHMAVVKDFLLPN